MTDLENFKAARIQWHKALFASPLLWGTEKAIGAYLINVRLNWRTGQLNPAVATIARDMAAQHRTVNTQQATGNTGQVTGNTQHRTSNTEQATGVTV